MLFPIIQVESNIVHFLKMQEYLWTMLRCVDFRQVQIEELLKSHKTVIKQSKELLYQKNTPR